MLATIRLGKVESGCTSRWSPPLDVLKIRFNIKPQASGIGGADPARNATTAVDANSIELMKSQQALDLDPRELVGEGILGAIGRDQSRLALFQPLPARAVAGLARLPHLHHHS